ncbi:hypothetical protein BU23DRAFT_279303 [Bimuria novae-zelandiae CBS 107.79]|uniref:Uncharacterized protein n=1 Tax=Bimuria novae-zelandiae CBS 107.79 TaxID=1447943 RepID=A0A6A5V3P8_9PLEO|nr:hypothetical protein BU23DRAFT_279303 [Bimuria novae-zelandiae CBS 107.79]
MGCQGIPRMIHSEYKSAFPEYMSAQVFQQRKLYQHSRARTLLWTCNFSSIFAAKRNIKMSQPTQATPASEPPAWGRLFPDGRCTVVLRRYYDETIPNFVKAFKAKSAETVISSNDGDNVTVIFSGEQLGVALLATGMVGRSGPLRTPEKRESRGTIFPAREPIKGQLFQLALIGHGVFYRVTDLVFTFVVAGTDQIWKPVPFLERVISRDDIGRIYKEGMGPTVVSGAENVLAYTPEESKALFENKTVDHSSEYTHGCDWYD